MVSNNPFDLTKLISNDKLIEKQKYKADVYTLEEQKQMLKNYTKIPREKWLEIPIGSNIRYIRKDGEMRKGGYIQYIDPNGQFMSISAINVSNGKHWKLPLNGVQEIWKYTGETLNKDILPNKPDDTQEIILSLKEEIRQLKIEIQRVMNQQKRIIKSIGVNAVRLDRIENRGR
jgi:hypothetical protein